MEPLQLNLRKKLPEASSDMLLDYLSLFGSQFARTIAMEDT